MKKSPEFLKAANSLFHAAIAAPFLLSLAARADFRLELLTHFRWQYLVLSLLSLLIGFLLKQKKVLGIAALLSLIHLLAILPLFVPRGSAAGGETYKMVLFNVNTRNQDFAGVQAFLDEYDPDFVLLLETNQAWLDGLRMDAYPYQITHPQENNFGIALFSKHALLSESLVLIGSETYVSIVAEIALENGPLTLIGTHPPPPIADGIANRRNIQIAEIFRYAGGLSGPVLLAGDFNATTWSPYLSGPLAEGEWTDTRNGFGVQSSWSTHFPWFLHIPIDHIFVSEGIIPINRALGPDLGSDHLPVVLEFEIP